MVRGNFFGKNFSYHLDRQGGTFLLKKLLTAPKQPRNAFPDICGVSGLDSLNNNSQVVFAALA